MSNHLDPHLFTFISPGGRPDWLHIFEWLALPFALIIVALGLSVYWKRQMRKSVSWHETILRTAMDGFWRVNRAGRILEVNDAYCRMTGYSHQELLCMRIADLEAAEKETEVAAHVRKVMALGEDSFETLHRRKDGSTVLLEVNTQYRSEDGGQFVVFLRDITARKTLEESLHQTHEQLQLVLQGSQLGFWDWNIETGTVERNERWAEMLGYTLQEVEFNVRQWTDLIHPDERKQAWDSISDHLEGRKPAHQLEYRMLTKDGSYKWILDQAQIVNRDATGKPLRMCGTHTDITDRKLAEQIRIREQVETEERFRLARELHDGSGQSLQAIRLHLKLLADGKGEGNIREELNLLAQEVANTAGELRDIAHQIRPSYLEETSLDVAMAYRCDMLQRRGMPVSIICSGDFSHLPHTVSDNIYRIFQEALANATRHADAGHIRVYLARSRSALRLIVSDNGCGMGETTDERGMGLRIMHERAALIGATLSIESEATWTTVTLALEEP